MGKEETTPTTGGTQHGCACTPRTDRDILINIERLAIKTNEGVDKLVFALEEEDQLAAARAASIDPQY
jgi:hypothetical protein